MPPSPPPLEELPEVCSDTQIEYSNQVMKLADSLLFSLFSEALGLKPNHLGDIDCDKGLRFAAHYAPACPQPDPTMGIPKHTNVGFLIVVLQNDIGGLQMLHQDQWVYVPLTPDTLVINVRDLLQASLILLRFHLISNDKFKSVEHRVVANKKEPRMSVALWFVCAGSIPAHFPNSLYV
ncbi:1-aminocyclopropane-1-carboxylate oxidase homolog 1-like protein [Tanacetum coccineum]